MTTAALGLGTYRCRSVTEAAEAAMETGVDWIDTAPNYQAGEAERQLAPILAAYPNVEVSTKVGYVPEVLRTEATRAGVLAPEEAHAGRSLHPKYVAWQVAHSNNELGRTPDLVFLHNPEHGTPELRAVERQLLLAFEALEEACDRGDLKGYGVATWTALHDGYLTVERLVDLATKAGGSRHRLRAVQLPLSLVHAAPITQALAGYGVLSDAKAARLDVYASAPLHGGELVEILTPAAAEQLIPGTTPLRIALGAVASSLGVTRILVSASTPEHWAEATAAIRPAFTPSELREITDALTS